jgi:hypothetical protein
MEVPNSIMNVLALCVKPVRIFLFGFIFFSTARGWVEKAVEIHALKTSRKSPEPKREELCIESWKSKAFFSEM